MIKRVVIILCFGILGACSWKNSFSADSLIQSDQETVRTQLAEKYHNTLNLEQAVSLAKERNLDLQIARIKQETAQIDKQIAIGNLLPQVNILADYTKNYDQLHLNFPAKALGFPRNLAIPVLDGSFHAWSLNAQLPVFVPSLWFLVSARDKGADLQTLLTSLSEKLITLSVMSEYFYLLSLKDEENALQNEKLSARELARQAEISLRTESILPWEFEEANAYFLSRELALQQNKREQETAYYHVLQSLHVPFDVQLTFLPPEKELFTLPSLEDCVLQALEHNEKWKISALSLQIRTDVKRSAISEFLPKIVLGGNMLNFDNNLLLEDNAGFFSIFGLLSIFNGFKTVNEYRKALLQEKIAEIELVKEYWTLITETYSAYHNTQNTQELFAVAKTNLQAMQGKFKQKKAEYKHESIDLKEYYGALKEYHEAISFYEKAYFQYRLAVGTLAIAMGKNPYRWNGAETLTGNKMVQK